MDSFLSSNVDMPEASAPGALAASPKRGNRDARRRSPGAKPWQRAREATESPRAPGRESRSPATQGRKEKPGTGRQGRAKTGRAGPRVPPGGITAFPAPGAPTARHGAPVLPIEAPGRRARACPRPGFHVWDFPISVSGEGRVFPISLCTYRGAICLNPISVSRAVLTKAFLLRLPEADFIAYAAAAARSRKSTAAFMRECLAVGARQVAGGEKAVAEVQNRPRPPAMQPQRQVRVAAGECSAQVGHGLRCRVCGKVHSS